MVDDVLAKKVNQEIQECQNLFLGTFVINEFNPTFEVQNMGNEAFQNTSFEYASLTNGNEGYSYLWAHKY